MNRHYTGPELTQLIMSEAGAWIARLNGPYRTRNAEQGFQQWLREDQRHAAAFRLITVDWEGMEDLRRFANVTISAPVSVATAVRPNMGVRLMRPALAAAIALAVSGGLFYYLQLAGVETGVGEQRILTLKDGTKVYLNTSTRIVVQYDEARRLVRLDSGEALFEVAQHRDRPFVVDAGDRQVQALGTAFLVRRDHRQLAITLVDGKVAVTPSVKSAANAGAASMDAAVRRVTLAPGQRLILAEHKAPAIDRPELDKLTAWQQGKVAIDKMQLSNAVDEMNRYSSVRLSIERPESARLLISGVFSVGQSASFARAVAQSYGLKIVEESDRIVLAGLPEVPQ